MRQTIQKLAVLTACLLCPLITPATVFGQGAKTDSLRSITQIPLNDDEYQFLTLGQGHDYVKAERWRIIDQIEQAIPALYEPRLPFHGYTLPPGAFRVAWSTTYARNAGDFGRDDFYSLFFNDVKMDIMQVNMNLLYGFEVGSLKDMVLNLNIPYKFQRTSGMGHPFRIEPMQMTMNGAANGIGDISLTLKKKWFDQGNGPLNFATMIGAIFPTANDNASFEASQTIYINGQPMMAVSADLPANPTINVFGREPDDLFFPRVAQPGNGSWGARLGFGATRQLERGAIHFGAVVDLLADNDGITPGDELKYGASFMLPPTSSDRITLDFSVFGKWRGDEKFPGTIMHPERDPVTGGPVMDASGNTVMFMTGRPDFKHGNTTFVSPSLILITRPNTRLIFSPAFRVFEPNQGPSPRWTMTVGQTFTF